MARRRKKQSPVLWILLLLIAAAAVAVCLLLRARWQPDEEAAESRSPSAAQTAPTETASVPAQSTAAPEVAAPADYLAAGIRLTEACAKNLALLPDGDGDFSDWIELYNAGGEAVDLSGWSLSDAEDKPAAWVFPAVTLQPGEYLLVFASGKDRAGSELHSSFSLSADETVYLAAPSGALIDSLPLSGVPEGQSAARDAAGQLVFSAYPTPGYPNTDEGYLAFCEGDGRSSPLLIWEAAVVDSQRGDWVELKNVSDAAIDLSGYFLTDNLTKSEKFQPLSGTLASGELVFVSCTAFGLSSAGESLYLCRNDGLLCDWVYLRGIPSGGTCGRLPGSSGWYYFSDSTPGGENGTGWRMVAEAPAASLAAGVYDEAESLTLAFTGEALHYTTDGSTPTAASPLYTEPLTVTETSVIRLMSCPEGKLPSPTATYSYFLRENSSLPIVSLVTDSGNLFGAQGIYTNHQRAWEEDWEREASVALFEDGGSFTIDCGIQIHGRTSRSQSEKRSIKLKFRGKYGGDLHYDVFGDGAVLDFSTLILRGSLQSATGAYMVDELFADLAMDLTSVPNQNYRHVSLYINGQYWGIYSIREHHDDDHFAAHYGVDADTVEMFNGYSRRPGTFSELLTYAENHDLASEEAWQYMQAHLDVDALIDWLILECWGGDMDVYENVRFYSSPEYKDNAVVYGLVDMDLCMNSHKSYAVGFETVGSELHWIIPHRLLANASFRDAFLTRLGSLLQTDMSDAAIQARLDALRAVVEPESARDLARWGLGDSFFADNFNRISAFTNGRAKEMADAAVSYFGLSAEQARAYFGSLAG